MSSFLDKYIDFFPFKYFYFLHRACLRAELGQDVSMESASGDSPMPVGITPRVTATPIRTPSIATEIKSRVGEK